MSSVSGFMIVLERDVGEEHAQRVCDAFRMMSGVASVVPIVGDLDTDLATERARWQILNDLGDVARRWRQKRHG